MQGVSLDQAPPYSIVLLFHITGVVYFLLFALSGIWFYELIENHFFYEAIALTHLFTLGFATHIMIGTLLQMVPVIIGEAYTNISSRAYFLYGGLNLGIIALTLGFFIKEIFLFIAAALVLGVTLFSFALYSLQTINRAYDKNAIVATFASAQLFLIAGVFLGAIGLFEHAGVFSIGSITFLHINILFFGWIFLLVCGVAFRVIPMFYVALEYPKKFQKWLSKTIFILLLTLAVCTFLKLDTGAQAVQMLLATTLLLFAFTTIKRLVQRKRARSDTTIWLWYFAMTNLGIGGLVLLFAPFVALHQPYLLILFFGLGFIYPLINGMLYKIVPFLTWFHLSALFIYEAEMGAVIKAKAMRLQFFLFIGSYILFVSAFFFKPFLAFAFFVLFCSTLVLLWQLLGGYSYYHTMLQKSIKA